MTAPRLTVIILNYNNYDDILACLDSLNNCRYSGLLRIVIIDNASTDDSFSRLKLAFPDHIFIHSDKNLGFAGGNNLGIHKYLNRTDYFLLLNNDTVITDPNFLTNLLKTKGDIVGTIVSYKQYGQQLYDFGGVVDRLFGRNHHLHNSGKADYYSGVCLLVKSSVFRKIGLLDPKYFFYYEDADFCLRATKHKLQLGFYPHCQITHKLSSSANKLGKTKLLWLANSHLRFVVHHLHPLALPFALSFNLYLRLKYICQK